MLSTNAEVEIAIEELLTQHSVQSDDSLTITSMPRKAPAVYMCGFIPKRSHNQALHAIAHDLMPNFFVSANPLQPATWNPTIVKNMLSYVDAVIFLLNESTIKDRQCLLTLQFAYDAAVPIVMLRHPRMRLIINPSAQKRQRQHAPDTPVLQDVIYDAYKSSLEYDRNNHLIGVRRLITKLRLIFNNNFKYQTDYLAPNVGRLQSKIDRKLPPISPPPSASRSLSQTRMEKSELAVRKSSSTGNLVVVKSEQISPDRKWATKTPNAPPNIVDPIRRNTPVFSRRSVLSRRSSSSFLSIDDPELYHETHYLIFPVRDRSHNPRLIRFPSDILEKNDIELKSIWGSDTSLEEEIERADMISGHLPQNETPPGTPAPYIDPL